MSLLMIKSCSRAARYDIKIGDLVIDKKGRVLEVCEVCGHLVFTYADINTPLNAEELFRVKLRP